MKDNAGWLGSLIRRQFSRVAGKPNPPRPLTQEERAAALEPEIPRRRATSEDMEKLHRHFNEGRE